MLDRAAALALIDDSMLVHSLETEAVLRALALRLGHDPELWGLTGLLHDLDYPETRDLPQRHGLETAARLAGQMPEEALLAISRHNDMNGSQPRAVLDFALRCGETVTGLIHAAALVRPTRLRGMEAKSLRKKMKDKAFAATVCRQTIGECERLGLELNEFLTLAIEAVARIKGDVGLA